MRVLESNSRKAPRSQAERIDHGFKEGDGLQHEDQSMWGSRAERMMGLSTIALHFRRDCLRFAARKDLGEDLRRRFREDADHWGRVAESMLRAAWTHEPPATPDQRARRRFVSSPSA
jgi:hypothetical protein